MLIKIFKLLKLICSFWSYYFDVAVGGNGDDVKVRDRTKCILAIASTWDICEAFFVYEKI